MNIKISIKVTPLITAYVMELKPINRRRANRQLSLRVATQYLQYRRRAFPRVSCSI